MKPNRIRLAALAVALIVIVSLVAPTATATTWTNRNAVITTGAGIPLAFGTVPGAQVHVYSASTSSATVVVQGAMASAGPWITLATVTNPTSTGEAYRGTAFPFLRANVTARSSGTLSAVFMDLPTDPGPWTSSIANATSTAPLFGVIKYAITNAAVAALGANLTGDIAIGTLPANSRVTSTYVDVTAADTSANALTVSLGTVGTGYVDWIVASDGKAVALYGDATAERGATNLDGALFYKTATPINSHFVKTTTNLSTVTAFAATVYVTYQTLP